MVYSEFYFIGLDGSFAPCVSALIVDIKLPIILIADIGKEVEANTRLVRVGYDNTIGYLDVGFPGWEHVGKEVEKMNSIKAAEFATKFQNDPKIKILDVESQ